MSKTMNIIMISIRFVLILSACTLFYFLLSKDLAFSGQLSDTYNFEKPSAMVLKVVPEGRVLPVEQDEKGRYFQRMIIDPVYFEVNIPRRFKQVEIQMKYKKHDQAIVELGIQEMPGEFSYHLKPVENKLIDQLEWFWIEEESMTLWQQEPKYETLDAFFEDIDARYTTTYHVNLSEYGIEDMNVNTDIYQYQYILTNYSEPEKDDEFVYTSTVFDLDTVGINDKRRLRFIISSPQLDINENNIDLYELSATVYDPVLPESAWFQKIYPMIIKPYEIFFQ